MVKNKVIAEKISDLALRFGKELDQSVALVEDECSDGEFIEYRNAVGKVMAELLTEIMNPIYRLHPKIKPDELYVSKK